ncbi:MAG: GntP family permease [Bacteroidetes bacterium]|nr:GntP family permease [Bacteroidota bacterium]
MVSESLIIINLIIAIAIILVFIMVLRWSPVVALICGSLYMGIASQVGLIDTMAQITTGFGDLMAAIGLSIGFGVIIGQLLYDCGGARSIALAMVRIFPKKYVLYGIGVAAFIFSIPVFFDVTFVILIPLALALTREINKPLPYAVGAMVIGAAAAHTLVPPTPNPLAAAEILQFDLGIMIVAGLVLGLLAALLAMRILFFFLDRGLWNEKKDQSEEISPEPVEVQEHAPGAGVALIPIIIPIVLILSGTIYQAFSEHIPSLVQFISHKVVAMLAGTIAAYVIAHRKLSKSVMGNSVQKAMGSAGMVLLITGAGGAFGAVIQATGIGGILAENIGDSPGSGIWAILITYGTAMVFRISQGSGTVAAITTMTIMAGAQLAQTVGVHPVWIAMAALSGGISIGHINDSGFWVTAKLSGFSVTGGLKIYTLGEFIISIIVLIISIFGSLWINP